MIRVNIETPTIQDFTAVMAALRGFPSAVLIGSELSIGQTDLPATLAPIREAAAPVAATEAPARKRRTAAEIAADKAAEAVTTAPIEHALPVPEAVVETVVETKPPVVETTAPVVETKAAAPEVDLNAVVREKLKAVRDAFDGAKMVALLKQFGVSAVKDVPPAKLPELIDACETLLATA
jgi:hypothetical protein